MNEVPALFFERIASLVGREEILSSGSALSGLLGLVTSEFYEKKCRQEMILNNGELITESYVNCGNQLVIKTPSSKHVHYRVIFICAFRGEYNTDPEAMERVLSATKGKHVLLCLKTSDISEEIAKCVKSIRLVFELHVDTKITSDVLKLMRSCVEQNTLNKLLVGGDVEIEDETTQLLVDLLKQKQLHEIYLRSKCSAALKQIIASWRENSEEMVGKMIYCKEGFSELQLLPEFRFEECSEEEKRDAKRAYYIPSYWPYVTAKSVLSNGDGSAVYCLSMGCCPYETHFVFA